MYLWMSEPWFKTVKSFQLIKVLFLMTGFQIDRLYLSSFKEGQWWDVAYSIANDLIFCYSEWFETNRLAFLLSF